MTNILTVDVLKDSIKNGVPGVRDAISKEVQENGADPKVLERDDQVQRARYAVNYLRKELSSLNVTEKRRVIEASRQVIQGALDGVSGELQAELIGTRAKDKLDALEAKKKTFTEARAEVVNLEVELADLKEQVGIEAREVSQDVRTAFKDKDWKTLAAYAVSVVGVAAATKWIWDHSIGWLWGKAAGNKEKPGFLRKAAAFAVTIGGAIAGGMGLSRFMRKTRTSALGVLPPAADGAANQAKEIIQDTTDVAAKDIKFLAELSVAFQQGNAMEYLGKNGASLVYENGAYVVRNSLGRPIKVHAELGKKIWESIMEGKVKEEVYYLWTASGVTIAFSKPMLDLFLKGRMPWAGGLMKNTLVGLARIPLGTLELSRDLAAAVRGVTSGKEGMQALKIHYMDTTWMSTLLGRISRVRELGDFRSTASVLEAFDDYAKFTDEIAIAKKFMTFGDTGPSVAQKLKSVFGITNAADIENLTKRANKFGRTLQTSLRSFPVDEHTPEIIVKLKESAHIHEINPEAFMDSAREELAALKKGSAAKTVETTGAKIADTVENSAGVSGSTPKVNPPEAPKAPLENTPRPNAPEGDLKKAAGAESMSKPQALPEEKIANAPAEKPKFGVVREDGSRVPVDSTGKVVAESGADVAKADNAIDTLSSADQAKLKALLGKFGDVEDVKNVRAFLEAATEQGLLKLDTDILALIDQSPGAQKIITGAVKSGEVTEVTRALHAARVARNWRVGFNAVGAVGDVFGLYMAVADFRENGRNLEQARNTNNAALMEVYKGARVMNLVEGAEASASLGYGVTVIGWSWYTGQGFCTAVSASGALIMLPIAAVVLTAGATRRMTTNASEISMRTAEDWVAALSPGELLEKLEEISPGSQGTYSQRQTMGSFAEQSFRWLGSRHSTKAREGFRDWNEDNARVIEGNNASARQEITKAYITHTSGDFLSPDAGEDQESYNKRFHQFVEDQMKYVEKSTAGSFMRLRGGYDRARTYATLLAKSRALQAEGKHEFLQWTDEGTGQKHQFDIAEFQNASWKDTGEAPSQFILLSHFIDVEKTMEVAGVVLTKKMSESAATAKVAVKQQLILAIADDIHWLDGRVQSANGSAAMKHGIASWLAGELERETSVLMDKDSIGFEDYAKARLRLGGFCHQKDLLQRVTDDQRRKINKPGRHSAEPASEILTPMGMMRRVTVAAERKQAA